MDFLLRKKYIYTVASSYNETKTKLEEILNGKWYDFSKKYHGTIELELKAIDFNVSLQVCYEDIEPFFAERT